MAWERVYTVNDFWDRPRLGVADVDGAPHIYDCIFDESLDDYSKTYNVSPIGQELLRFVLEDWEIWLRWQDAFHRGLVKSEEHPSLPEDRMRHEQLKALIGDQLRVNPNHSRKMTASFKTQKRDWNTLWEVEWGEIEPQ